MQVWCSLVFEVLKFFFPVTKSNNQNTISEKRQRKTIISTSWKCYRFVLFHPHYYLFHISPLTQLQLLHDHGRFFREHDHASLTTLTHTTIASSFRQCFLYLIWYNWLQLRLGIHVCWSLIHPLRTNVEVNIITSTLRFFSPLF